jgi:hypothetical protein
MASFRGINRDALIDSLRRAEQFLRQCDLGPETGRVLDSWAAFKPIDALSRARDEKSLLWAMTSTGTTALLPRFHDVFAHHAMKEFQNGGSGSPAQKLYRDLSAWSAFENKPARAQVPAEVVEHVILDCIDLLHERGASQAVPESGDDLRTMAGYAETAAWLEDTLPVLDLMSGTGKRPEARSFINGDHPVDKIILKGILYNKTGLSNATAALDVPHAIRRYAIVPAVAGDVPTDIEDELNEYLQVWRRTGEFASGSVRLLSDGFENIGVAFRATERVAQDVAAGFSRKIGFRLVDAEGQACLPSAQPS